MKRKPLAVFIVGAIVGFPDLALAQSRTALEEVIVTAQKRDESLQDVPIAISALSADTLQKQGVANLMDFQRGQVPALRVVKYSGRPNALQLGIRGITENDPSQLTVERPIAVYVDGIYFARGNAMDAEVFDVERMEILRGPQGTLFGRNAEGGAISIVTRKPNGEFGFKQELEASSLDEYKSRTIVDTPTWNGLSASFTYLKRQANGWINNPGRKHDFNWEDKEAYRAALQYNTDNVVVDYAYDRSESDYLQNYNALLHKPAASLNPRPVDNGRPDQAFAGTRIPMGGTVSEGHALSVEWTINDSMSFKSITGYRDLHDFSASTGTGSQVFLPGSALGMAANTGISDSNSFTETRQDQMSQEFQLFGDADRLEWQTGVMYFHEDGQVNGSNSLGWLYTGCDPLVYRATCGAPNIIPLTAMPTNFTRTNVATDSYGVYGQATWTPNILDDRLKLTLGLRYSNDEKDIERTLQSGAPVSGMKTTATSERVDPAVTVSYELFDSTSVYARYSTAYRGGGVSVRQIQTFTPYDPEEVESSELGIKSVFWDNRARVNAAAFYTEMDDMQTTVQQVCFRPGTTIPLCTASNTIFFNNPKTSRMSGFEMDASVIVVEGLTLSLAYSYLDASIPKVLDGTALRQPALSNSPRNSWAVNIDYDFEPFSFGQLSAHVDITDSDEYCFSVFSCEADAPMIAGDQEGVQGGNDNRLVNANLTLSDIPLSQFGTLKAALWGRNLTDGEYLNFGYTVPGGPATGNNSIGQYGEPRSWGVSLTYQY